MKTRRCPRWRPWPRLTRSYTTSWPTTSCRPSSQENRLGFDSIYFQAKRWAIDTTVTTPEVQKFSGALNGQHAGKDLFITTARFSEGARKYVEAISGQRIVLVDGKTLARLIIDCNVGVTVKETYTVKAIDTDFFDS